MKHLSDYRAQVDRAKTTLDCYVALRACGIDDEGIDVLIVEANIELNRRLIELENAECSGR